MMNQERSIYFVNGVRVRDQEEMETEEAEDVTEQEKPRVDGRLSKRLCYVLRFGAAMEGLEIHERGFVDFKELMALHIMRHNTEDEVLTEVETSLSCKRQLRFEKKEYNGRVLVRAKYGRKFERNPCHDGSSVNTLLETCIQNISENLEMYDLEDFPDEYLITAIFHKLKRQKKLSNQNLRYLLVPALTTLDLDGDLYVTQATIKAVWNSCPHLKALSLQNCGYVVTDNLMGQLLKRLPELEKLNLQSCSHLTDVSVNALCRRGKKLKGLNISFIENISEAAVIKLVLELENLTHLDVYSTRFTQPTKDALIEIVKSRTNGLVIAIKGYGDHKWNIKHNYVRPVRKPESSADANDLDPDPASPTVVSDEGGSSDSAHDESTKDDRRESSKTPPPNIAS